MIKECKYRMSLPEEERGCIEHKCHHYQDVFGKHPQTGELIKEFMCDDLLRNILTIENSKMQMENGKAIDSLRNESVKSLFSGMSNIAKILRLNKG